MLNYNIVLHQPTYTDQNPERNAELRRVEELNKKNPSFSHIVEYDNERFTYNDLFKRSRMVNDFLFPGEGVIHVFANADIYFPTTFGQQLRNIPWSKNLKLCLALSRWDIQNEQAICFDRADSQDVWIMYNYIQDIPGADFYMGGVAGCDNVIAYLLEKAGYTLYNPCFDIRCYHLHETPIRNYIVNGQVKDRLPPPYRLVEPIRIAYMKLNR